MRVLIGKLHMSTPLSGESYIHSPLSGASGGHWIDDDGAPNRSVSACIHLAGAYLCCLQRAESR
jgi:hypothetical protein